MDSPRPRTASAEALPRAIKIGYGAAEIGVLATETLARLNVLKFYTDVVGLRPELAGLAAALAIFWDAFADLAIGMVSDRTRSRFGRRRPYVLGGGIALALSIVVLFRPPLLGSQAAMAASLLASFIFMNTAVSLLSVPHTALASELTTDANERTTLFGYRLFLGNLGLLAGAVLPGYALTRATHGDWSTREAYGLASLAIGALVLATSLTTFLATHGRDPRVVADPSPISIATFVSGAAHVLRDRTFLPILLAYVIAQLGVAINGTFALYYYQYRLELTSDEISIVLGIFVTAWSVSIPLWVLGARRFGKRWPAFFGIVALGIVTAVIYLLCPPRELRLPITIAVVGGALAGSIVLLEALVADVVDVDRLLHRGHREGLYFGVWKMGAKVGRGLAVAGSGAMLAAIGFVPNASQTAVVRDRLAWLFGPGVGAFFVLGALVFLASPLTEARHARVQMALARRRRIEAKREAPSA